MRGYVRRLRSGRPPRGRPAGNRRRRPGLGVVVDGDIRLSALVTSVFAMRTAMARARACGVGYAGVRNSCHFGAAGYYAALAAAADMIGLAMANETPSVSGAGLLRGRVTGSNPLAYAVPTGDGRPILLDMATSIVAGGKVAAAHAAGKPIPADWVVDRDGKATTDPAAFLAGGALVADGRTWGDTVLPFF